MRQDLPHRADRPLPGVALLAWAFASLACAVGGAGAGCAAGQGPQPTYRNEHDKLATALAIAQATRPLSGDAATLQAELITTESGRVLQRCLDAYGGWERWTSFSTLSLVRRVASARASQEPGSAGSEERSEKVAGPLEPPLPVWGPRTEARWRLDAETGHLWPLASPASGEEADLPDELLRPFFPFELLSPTVRLQLQGVEIDARTGDSFKRLRGVGSPAGDRDVTAYIGTSTSRIERVLWRRPGRPVVLIVYSAWSTAGGVPVPQEARCWLLRGLFDHWDLASPRWIARFEDVRFAQHVDLSVESLVEPPDAALAPAETPSGEDAAVVPAAAAPGAALDVPEVEAGGADGADGAEER